MLTLRFVLGTDFLQIQAHFHVAVTDLTCGEEPKLVIDMSGVMVLLITEQVHLLIAPGVFRIPDDKPDGLRPVAFPLVFRGKHNAPKF